MPLMRLGDFIFNSYTTNFQESVKRYSWEWVERDKLAGENSLNNGGVKAPIRILTGTIFHDLQLNINILNTINTLFGNQSLEQLKRMGDASARSGESYPLFDGIGRNLGRWVIVDLNVQESKHNQYGVAIKQEFTMELKQDIEATRLSVNTLLDYDVLKVSADNMFIVKTKEGLKGISDAATKVSDYLF